MDERQQTAKATSDLLWAKLLTLFPAPWPDELHDECWVESVSDLLRRAQQLKSQSPRLLGISTVAQSEEAIDTAANWQQARWEFSGTTLAQVGDELLECLHGLPVEVHPRNQVNVNAQPTVASIAGVILPTLFNPNLSSDGRGAGCSLAELRVIGMLADLLGMEADRVGGVFTFGGTGTMLYGVKLGLERACPGAMQHGLSRRPVVIASLNCHHTVLTAAGWLGIGQEHVWFVDTHDDNSLDLSACERLIRQAVATDRPIAAIIATVGTTDAFGVDEVGEIAALRDRLVEELQLDYRPHIHADAVIGWAWNCWTEQELAENSLQFSEPVIAALRSVVQRVREVGRADSLGIDFHKTAFVPYISSLLLVRDRQDLSRLARDRSLMPYLFHSGAHHPGMFTLETTRSASGVLAALASLRVLGRQGLQLLLGRAVQWSLRLREKLREVPGVVILNPLNFGPVTLYRVYPDELADDPELTWNQELTGQLPPELTVKINAWNRRLHELTWNGALGTTGSATKNPALQAEQNGTSASAPQSVIGWTERYRRRADGVPLAALKSYLLSPFLDESFLDELLGSLQRAITKQPFDQD
ncbi:MAG: pyridoxal phosphate-dependent decarboxylase family protein [Planctomycetota bacterium]